MKNLRSKGGPFSERPHFKLSEIEEICTAELRTVGLYPASPEPIRIERFIEKRWQSPRYEDLPDGILGFTKFGKQGVEAIVVSNALDDASKGKPNERRLRTTLAHEAGFTADEKMRRPSPSLFGFGFRRAKTDRDRDLGRVFDSPRGEDYRDACPKSDFPVKNSAPDVGAEK